MAAVENIIVCLYTSCLMSLDEVKCDSDVRRFLRQAQRMKVVSKTHQFLWWF